MAIAFVERYQVQRLGAREEAAAPMGLRTATAPGTGPLPVADGETPVSPSQPELSVILPAYNEEGVIADVVSCWVTELEALGIDYELRAYDDGSTDTTGAILRDLAGRLPRLVVVSQVNRGHGPTILRGYGEARGEWVFQADGDGETGPRGFAELWARRDQHDFLLGCREGRRPALARRILTYGARMVVWGLFGSPLRDVNSPFRLMRRAWLQAILPCLSSESFAPNVAIAGLAACGGLRIYERPVPYRPRRTGTVSIVGYRLWRGAVCSLVETVAVAVRCARRRRT